MIRFMDRIRGGKDMEKEEYPKKGEIWVNEKGSRYRIFCSAVDKETGEGIVIFRREQGIIRKIIVPIDDFMQKMRNVSNELFSGITYLERFQCDIARELGYDDIEKIVQD